MHACYMLAVTYRGVFLYRHILLFINDGI